MEGSPRQTHLAKNMKDPSIGLNRRQIWQTRILPKQNLRLLLTVEIWYTFGHYTIEDYNCSLDRTLQEG